MKASMIATLGLLLTSVAMAQPTGSVSTISWQSSYRFYGLDSTTPSCVGVQAADPIQSSFSVTPFVTPGFNWTNSINTSASNPVNVEWQGAFSFRGPGPGHFDDFTVMSNVPAIRLIGSGISSAWYRCVSNVNVDDSLLLGFGYNGGNGDDDILVKGSPDIPVRSIRLELFESAAGGEAIGSVIHSVEYEMPAEVDPIMSVRNLHFEPVHFMASSATYDIPLEIGDHDDYAGTLGMVSDGVMRTLPAAGDFDENGMYEIVDIDALAWQIFEASQGAVVDPIFDINGDGNVDAGDGERWLENAGAANNSNPFLPSDGNLDGVVDGSDFILWNAHKFSSNPRFSAGNWNYDGVVDGSDFLLWNAHKFSSSDVTTVPEPSAMFVLLASVFGVATSLRRQIAGSGASKSHKSPA